MANTVPILGYANTFGDWVVATNANSNEINILGKSNWTKDSGTLYLNGGTTGISVGNNAIVQGQLQVTGTGSSALIDNNLTVGGQVYFTNTTQSLAASGPMFANGKLYATNTGVSLQVSNNTVMGGFLSVAGNVSVANTVTVTGYANLQSNLSVYGPTVLSNTITVTKDSTLQGNLAVSLASNLAGAIVGQSTMNIYGSTAVNYLQSNTAVNTASLSVVANTMSGNLIANNAVTSSSLYVTNKSVLNGQANTNADLGVSGNLYITTNATITGKTTLTDQANTGADLGVSGNVYVSTNATISGTTTMTGKANTTNDLGVGGNAYVTGKTTLTDQANTTNDLGVGGNAYVTGTGSFNTTISVANGATIAGVNITPYAVASYASQNITASFANSAYTAQNTTATFANGAFDRANSSYAAQNITASFANSAYTLANNLQSGAQTHTTLTVTSNTALNGYANTKDIGIAGNVYMSGTSVLNVPNYLDMHTTSSSANIYSLSVGSGGLNVLGNFTISGTTVYNTPTFILSSGTPITTGQYAQFGVFRTANGSANGVSSNSYIRWNETNGRFDVTANASVGTYSNILLASDISDSNNTTSSTTVASSTAVMGVANLAQSAYTAQNTTFIHANSAFNLANTHTTNISTIQGVDTTQNTNITNVTANAAAAFLQANAANTLATTANNAANTWLTFKQSGGTISGDVGITGNLFVNGNTSYINVATFQTVDSLIELAANNLTDTVDIGFYGQYASGGTKYSGLTRKAAGNYVLFQGIGTNPTSNSVGSLTATDYATLNANIAAGQITSTVPIAIASGGTGANTATGALSALGAYAASNPNSYTSNLGTVTSVAISTATAGNDITSSVSSSTTTPSITLNIPTANANNRGVLSSTDWTTFNNKQPAGSYLTSVTADAPLSGSGTSGSHLSIPVATGSANGYLSSSDWTTFNSKQSALGTANATISGILSSTDWSTFNNKQPAGSYVTSGGALGTPSSGTLTNCTFPTLNQSTTGSAGSVVGSSNTTLSSTELISLIDTSTVVNATGPRQKFERTFTPSTSSNYQIAKTTYYGKSADGTTQTMGEIYSTVVTGSTSTKYENIIGFKSYCESGTNGLFTLGQNAANMMVSVGGSSFSWRPTYYAPNGDNVSTLGLSGTRWSTIYGYSGNFSSTTNSTSTTTGAIVTAGGVGVAQDVYAGGNVTAYSDRRLKDNLEIIPNALDKVSKINGYTYTRNDFNDRKETGVIAQEILEVLPEAVFGSEDSTYSVAYGNMVGLLVEAIKELKAEIEELKKGK